MNTVTLMRWAVAVAALLMAADTANAQIVITCGACQESPSDPFLQYNYEAAQRFNAAHQGQYEVEIRHNQYANSGGPERLQYYQRLALADDLPDMLLLNAGEIKELQQTGRLRDLASDLAADVAWRDSFSQNVFNALSGDEGQIWAIPQQRDAIGIYYNRDLLASVGYDEFPQTWEEFEDAAEKLRDAGHIPIAMDGAWSTLLMWSNLIGTDIEGNAFLDEGIRYADAYLSNPAVVTATETLRRWHNSGYVNTDAFSGDFQNAAAAFLAGEAAMIANGPWMVNTQIRTSAAIENLYEITGYAPSPGWKSDGQGVIVVTGAGWSSGHIANDEKAEAVLAFLKFLSSADEQLEQARLTGARPAIQIGAEALQASSLEPLGSGLAEQADALTFTYPHWRVHAPGGFEGAWRNLWPAYVGGEMDTETFLQRLASDARAQTQG